MLSLSHMMIIVDVERSCLLVPFFLSSSLSLSFCSSLNSCFHEMIFFTSPPVHGLALLCRFSLSGASGRASERGIHTPYLSIYLSIHPSLAVSIDRQGNIPFTSDSDDLRPSISQGRGESAAFAFQSPENLYVMSRHGKVSEALGLM